MSAEKGSVSVRVRRYFTDAPGQEIRIADIVRETGLSRKQVLNVLSGMRFRNEPIETVISGQVYKLAPNTTKSKIDDLHLMKLVGTLQGGESLFQNTESGELWKSVRL